MRGELDAAYQPRPVLLAIAGDPGIHLRDIETSPATRGYDSATPRPPWASPSAAPPPSSPPSPRPATRPSREKAAATATRSRPASRCPGRRATNPPTSGCRAAPRRPRPSSQQPAIGELLDLLTSQRETTEHS